MGPGLKARPLTPAAANPGERVRQNRYATSAVTLAGGAT
jgi:hypothetical protein